ncbi:MAG: protein kinase domain-containing protein, partial [Dehalococcoidia bacterium]
MGERLQDRYRLDERIATGGMGTVYQAHDERLNRKVAVKLLKEDLAGDVRFVERFRREARAVASLSHPNIANV